MCRPFLRRTCPPVQRCITRDAPEKGIPCFPCSIGSGITMHLSRSCTACSGGRMQTRRTGRSPGRSVPIPSDCRGAEGSARAHPRMPIFPEAPPAPKLQPASVAPLPAARKRPARKSLRTCRTSVKKRGSVARLSPGRRSLSPAQAGRCFASCVHALHLLPGSGAAMPASAKTPKPPHRQSTGGSFVPREGRAFQAQKKAPPGRGLIFTWR